MRSAATLLVAGLSSACAPTGDAGIGGPAPDAGLNAPGVASSGQAVDPLIVGDRLMEAGESELALDAYARAAARDGLTPEIRQGLAAANAGLGRLGQAERLLRSVVEEEPRNAAALNDLGVVLLMSGRAGEALRVLRAAFALQPDPEIRNNLRVAETTVADRTYPDQIVDDAFTLTRRGGGLYQLSPPTPQ